MKPLYREGMTLDQQACFDLLCRVFGGEHHLANVYGCGSGIKVNMPGDRLATFDLDYLTRLVVLAHDECVRVEVAPGGPYRVKSCCISAIFGAGGLMSAIPPWKMQWQG